MKDDRNLETLVRAPLDPDFWLEIPEFGINPISVSFKGFAIPIVEEGATISKFHLLIRQNVRTARQLVQLRFTSQEVLKNHWREYVTSDFDSEISLNHNIANIYMEIIFSQRVAMRDIENRNAPGLRRNTKNDNCLFEMAKTAALFRSWALTLQGINDEPVNALMQKISERNRKSANARHSKPGASRDKQEMMRNKWIYGAFTDRDRCAEEECAGLNMSFSAARKALINVEKAS